jgi:hypothetical protein
MTGEDLDRVAAVLSRLTTVDLTDTKAAGMERVLRNILALVAFPDYSKPPEVTLETIKTLVEQVLFLEFSRP